MKNAVLRVARPVKVQRNTSTNARTDKWARIVDASNGEILHTGQLPYIRKVALQRYGYVVVD